jgi:hypothetical protein
LLLLTAFALCRHMRRIRPECFISATDACMYPIAMLDCCVLLFLAAVL